MVTCWMGNWFDRFSEKTRAGKIVEQATAPLGNTSKAGRSISFRLLVKFGSDETRRCVDSPRT